MKKILLFIDKKESPDRDIFKPTDYHNIYKEMLDKGSNTGNKVWLSAVEQYITQPDITYDYYNDSFDIEYINTHYDMIIFPCANRIRNDLEAINDLDNWSNFFNRIKIPTYVIGIGAQASSFDDMNKLVGSLKKNIISFTNSISHTGGDIAVRGYFTQELLEKCGYKQSTVIGCPSMYSQGRDLTINKIIRKEFRLLLNIKLFDYSNVNIAREIYNNEYCESIDQNIFCPFLFNKDFIDIINESNKFKLMKVFLKYPYEALYLLSKNRMKLFYDIPIWFNYLKKSEFTFSYGSRIHGSIMSLLSGIPTVLFDCDARTREIAEFFSIPIDNDRSHSTDISDIFDRSDFKDFNNSFKHKFDDFNKYMSSRGITKDVSNRYCYDSKISNIEYVFPPELDKKTLNMLSLELNRFEKYHYLLDFIRNLFTK